jgi:hypothetical protein
VPSLVLVGAQPTSKATMKAANIEMTRCAMFMATLL